MFKQPTPEQGKYFFQNLQGKGSFVMLNLIEFNEKAAPLDLDEVLSGEEAYQLYLKNIQPELAKMGSEIVFQGTPNSYLVGPINKKWDVMLLVKHQSVEKFLAFSTNKVYLENVKYQSAAIKDFRLLPIL